MFTYATDIIVSGIASDIYAAGSNFSLTESGGIARNLYYSQETPFVKKYFKYVGLLSIPYFHTFLWKGSLGCIN